MFLLLVDVLLGWFCWGFCVFFLFFRGLLFFVLFVVVVDDGESQSVSRIVFTNITSNRTWAIKKRKKRVSVLFALFLLQSDINAYHMLQ